MSQVLLEEVAGLIAEVARAEVMPRWRNLGSGDIAEKTGPADIVTVADQETERVLTERLKRLLAGSEVVGEEAVSADGGVLGLFRSQGPVWVIDPIDGTSAFAAGEPEFAVMVALVEGGRLRAGWIDAPALGLRTAGGPGLGIRHASGDGAGRSVPKREPPAGIAAMTGLLGKRNISDARRAELEAKARHFHALDGVTCAGLDYPRLAIGEAHFALYGKCEPWDHLPGLAILSGHDYRWCRHDGSAYGPGDNTGGLVVAPDTTSLEAIRRVLVG
jgi:fructose-1,6-bisphosphatase/inositol monophosphatase family enzyme